MRNYDCFFEFSTLIKSKNRKIKELERLIDEKGLNKLSEIILCGIDFDQDALLNKYSTEKELEWSGYWSLDAESEEKARKMAEEVLAERIVYFEEKLREILNGSDFELSGLKNKDVTFILEY